MPLGGLVLYCLHMSQPSPMVPSSCLHVAVTTPLVIVLTSQQYQVRVANRSQTLGELQSLHILACKVSFSRLDGWDHQQDTLARKAVLQHFMESTGMARYSRCHSHPLQPWKSSDVTNLCTNRPHLLRLRELTFQVQWLFHFKNSPPQVLCISHLNV